MKGAMKGMAMAMKLHPLREVVGEAKRYMLWCALSGFFLWLAAREVYFGFVPRAGFDQPNPTISTPYVLTTIAIAAAFAYTPARYWWFERFLTQKAQILSESRQAFVHCNTVFDTLFDPNSLAAGHANFETGQIVFQQPWCGELMDYLDSPQKATPRGIWSLQLFAHEAMHVRGERDEARTECQAIQRFVRAAVLLGVSERLAREHGMVYFNEYYKQRRDIGGLTGQYHSDECAPGRALDERLHDSTWR